MPFGHPLLWMEPEAAFGGARRSLDEAPGKNLDGLLSLPPFPAGGPCRNAALAGAGGASSPPAHGPSGYAPLDGPLPPFGSGEPSLAKQCIPCPAVSQTPSASSTSPFPYGCLGGGCYSYRVARSALKPCPAPPQAAYTAEKYLEVCGAAANAPPAPEDYPTRPAEFAFYPGYAGPYQSMTSYLDVSVVQALGGPPGDPRHETLLPVDPYHDSWALAGGWNNQVCCPKEPNPPGPFWKTAFTGKAWCLESKEHTATLAALGGGGADGKGLRNQSWSIREVFWVDSAWKTQFLPRDVLFVLRSSFVKMWGK